MIAITLVLRFDDEKGAEMVIAYQRLLSFRIEYVSNEKHRVDFSYVYMCVCVCKRSGQTETGFRQMEFYIHGLFHLFSMFYLLKTSLQRIPWLHTENSLLVEVKVVACKQIELRTVRLVQV